MGEEGRGRVSKFLLWVMEGGFEEEGYFGFEGIWGFGERRRVSPYVKSNRCNFSSIAKQNILFTIDYETDNSSLHPNQASRRYV